MKVVVLALALFVASVSADTFDIDWSNVKPITQFPEFWDNKPAELRPSASYFEKFENDRRSGRIVGGQIAEPHQFPYQVALLITFAGGTGLCGGSILSSRTILTAAHCIDGASSGTVILGAHNRLVNEPNQVRVAISDPSLFIMHPDWDPSLIRNDIGVIHLPTAVTLNAFIRPAILPLTSDINNSFAGELGVVSGWGVFSDAIGQASDVLRYVYDNVMTNTACSIRFPGVIQPSNICVTGTNGRGACSGDSGGPLTVHRGGESMQVGVVSFGLALGCERSWPSAFVRVTSFLPWIQQNLFLFCHRIVET
ncbi:CLUMA_CG003990, isoform A [Clunio marinus]|uniref:CLUMA_CG003990, isoform A n=1 Tax=Clunio marinus TaxID=568069 RepID=A0A1J1HUW3_9DIPT|nr:CLUMA_CG003990, isoform A [Clunio marinus]